MVETFAHALDDGESEYMTQGHKHRMITVKAGGLVERVLRRPLFHCRHLARVDASPYPYGPCPMSIEPVTCWTLSALGILHRWTGLTLYTKD
jgi:hypothetical protein